MPRDYRASENMKRAKAKRDLALTRGELRGPSHPRASAAGPTSAPIKLADARTSAMIAEFLAKRGS